LKQRETPIENSRGENSKRGIPGQGGTRQIEKTKVNRLFEKKKKRILGPKCRGLEIIYGACGNAEKRVNTPFVS